MHTKLVTLCLVAMILIPEAQAARVKDISTFKGVRFNQLIGYGLVVGLEGTGDREQTSFTVQSLTSMLGKLGIGVNAREVRVRNVAAVMVTAKIPAFAKAGSRIDVMVSSVGDARSLQGGTLILTPMKAANQKIYAISQGSVLVGGFGMATQNATFKRNHLTVGKIPNGGVVEREVNFSLENKRTIELILNEPDFTTVDKLGVLVNGVFGEGTALPKDSGSLFINIPEAFQQKMVAMLSQIENLQIEQDSPAKVVLNERTGTIVMGENVRVATIAIAHGNLTISVAQETQVSQPNAFAQQGQTAVVQQPTLNVESDGKGTDMVIVPKGVSINEVVKALNAVGVNPRDMISIFQAIKASGALQAELEII